MREACDLILKDIDGAGGGRARARRRAPAHADDRPHPRRARRADDVRPEAGAVVRRAQTRRASACSAPGRSSRSARSRARSAPSRISIRRSKPSVCRAPRPGAGAGLVAGDSARPSRRADDRARDHGRVAREVRAGNPRSAEDRNRRSRGAVRQGPEGLVRHAAQAQSDRLRADRRPRAAAAGQRAARRSRTSRCGTSATSRIRRWSA